MAKRTAGVSAEQGRNIRDSAIASKVNLSLAMKGPNIFLCTLV
jgi:hypothetical protein